MGEGWQSVLFFYLKGQALTAWGYKQDRTRNLPPKGEMPYHWATRPLVVAECSKAPCSGICRCSLKHANLTWLLHKYIIFDWLQAFIQLREISKFFSFSSKNLPNLVYMMRSDSVICLLKLATGNSSLYTIIILPDFLSTVHNHAPILVVLRSN